MNWKHLTQELYNKIKTVYFQEKRVEQALNLDLNNLSEKQLVDIFSVVTDEPECKAQK